MLVREVPVLTSSRQYEYLLANGTMYIEKDGIWGKRLAAWGPGNPTVQAAANDRPGLNSEDPNIVAHPADVSVAQGGNAQFAVQANSDAGHELSYQWQKAPPFTEDFMIGALPEYEGIEGANQATYTENNVTEDMSGTLYRCLVSVPGNEPETTNAAKLTVGE